jgi:hypothetical protein
MSNDTLIARIACGAAAGLMGMFALQGIRGSSQKLLPETTPDPGGSRRVPGRADRGSAADRDARGGS